MCEEQAIRYASVAKDYRTAYVILYVVYRQMSDLLSPPERFQEPGSQVTKLIEEAKFSETRAWVLEELHNDCKSAYELIYEAVQNWKQIGTVVDNLVLNEQRT